MFVKRNVKLSKKSNRKQCAKVGRGKSGVELNMQTGMDSVDTAAILDNNYYHH